MADIYTTIDERNEIINKKLANTIKYAYKNSPFYRRMFYFAKVKPEDIVTPNDLEKLAIVDKHDLVKSQPPNGRCEFFSAPDSTNTILYTSGTTGQPKIIAMSDTDTKVYARDCKLMYEMSGIKKGDCVLDMYPFGINSSGIMSWLGFEEMGVQVIPLGVSPFPPKELIIKLHKPNVLFGLTSFMERMAFELESKGIEPDKLNIEKIVVSGESSTKEKRDKISKLFNADVVDLYGTTEFSAIGVDCFKKDGIHVMDHTVLIRIVDSETNKEVEDGKVGKVIITRLIDEFETPGTLLINYFIGDEAKIISREMCDCSRPYTRISNPRRADGAIFASGAKIDQHDLESIITNPTNRELLTGDFEIVVDSKLNGPCELLCRIEPKSGVVLPEGYAEQIANALKSINFPLANEVMGKRIELSVYFAKENEFEICKKPGKPKRILDKRKE